MRTIASYGAIALDNANAYEKLKRAQQKLVEQEKMAALGSLVAGIAHELNTPIGNSLLGASTLLEQYAEFAQRITQQQLRRTDLQSFLEHGREGLQIILRGLSNAASLVDSFKKVAASRSWECRAPYELRQTCEDIIAPLRSRVIHAGHALLLEVPDGILMYGYPDSLGQALTLLVDNALLHGLEKRKHGHILLRAQMTDSDHVRLELSDNGRGIPAEHLTRIFEPFFTSKLGQGGSGLGLSICYNIVNSILHGHIHVESQPGAGACFVLKLPLWVKNEVLSA